MAHKRIIHNTRVFNMHGGAVNSRWTPIAGSGGARRICRSIHIKNTLLLKDIRPRNIPGSYCCTVFSDCDALISFLQGKRGTQNENLQGVNALGRAYPISTASSCTTVKAEKCCVNALNRAYPISTWSTTTPALLARRCVNALNRAYPISTIRKF